MSRRSFFGRLFGKKEEATHSFFGLQLVLDYDARPVLRSELHALIQSPAPTNPDERRLFYKKLSGVLMGTEPFWNFGYVEYVESNDAGEDFRLWVTDIEDALATEEEETGDEVDDAHRFSQEKKYIVLSIAVLMEGFHRDFRTLSDDDERMYTRFGMADLVREFSRLDYARVLGDAVFLAPGTDDDGFSDDDLAGEGWEYLLPLS